MVFEKCAAYPVNTATKLALLTHAFGELECVAVAFHTHVNNTASRTAILRLGAKEEGTLRNHRIMPDGAIRDTVCFSIIRDNWRRSCLKLLGKLWPEFTRITGTYLNAQDFEQESLKALLIRCADQEPVQSFKIEFVEILEHKALRQNHWNWMTNNEFDTPEEFDAWMKGLWVFLYEDGPAVW